MQNSFGVFSCLYEKWGKALEGFFSNAFIFLIFGNSRFLSMQFFGWRGDQGAPAKQWYYQHMSSIKSDKYLTISLGMKNESKKIMQILISEYSKGNQNNRWTESAFVDLGISYKILITDRNLVVIINQIWWIPTS